MKKAVISGVSGLIGSRLNRFLRSDGYSVTGLSRHAHDEVSLQWDPSKGVIPPDALNDVDVVINLAGANIADRRWTGNRKKILRDSRIMSTRTLVNAMQQCEKPPSLFISMSGVNFYACGEKLRTEADPAGDTYLAALCQEWEAEALKAGRTGIRTVIMRLGVVLDLSGGALKKMLPAFRMGMGGAIGSGKQGFPWISMTELMQIFHFTINNPCITGPLNAVHPQPLSQGEFAEVLAKLLNRPSLLSLPEFVVRILFGQMGRETLLSDLNVCPEKLLRHGYVFRETNLHESLQNMFSE